LNHIIVKVIILKVLFSDGLMEELEEIVRLLKDASTRLAEELRDEFLGLALFGSWARGEADEKSDVDVLVVLRSIGGFDVRGRIYGILSGKVRKPLTLIDIRVDEVLDKEYEVTPLMLNILYDAVVIYDPQDILRKLIEDCRVLINKANLERYRLPDGKYGWRRIDGKPIALYSVSNE